MNRPPAFGQGEDVPITGKVIDRVKAEPVQGYVPVIDLEPDGAGDVIPVPKLRPWWDSPVWVNNDTGATGWHPSYRPGAVSESIEIPVPPEVRTTARAKYEALIRLLTQEATRFTQPDGSIGWPASVQRDLSEAAWKQGKAGRLTKEEQVELLARNYLVFSANKQKEIDNKQVTTDWHRHYVA